MSTDLTKHFWRRHLPHLPDKKIYCLISKMWLDHKMHFQDHAMQVYGLKSSAIKSFAYVC